MIAADRLGLPLRASATSSPTPPWCRRGGGTGGARSLQMGGIAVGRAAGELLDRAPRLAAELLEVDAEDLAPGEVDGAPGLEVRGVPGTGVDLGRPRRGRATSAGSRSRSTTTSSSGTPPSPSAPTSSVVEVDTETGPCRPLRHVAVDDCGTVLNPLLVAGQQHGGAVQGISQALWEEFRLRRRRHPAHLDLRRLRHAHRRRRHRCRGAHHRRRPRPHNELGAKGIGEAATIGATPAVQNAVVDALSHLGVRHVDIPATPARVHAALRDAAAAGSDPWREPPGALDAPVPTLEG